MIIILTILLGALCLYLYYVWRKYIEDINQIKKQYSFQKSRERKPKNDVPKEQFIEKEENIKKVEIESQVCGPNRTLSMYYLYPKELFIENYTRKTYEEIILENYLLQEPFYSLIVRLLSIIETSRLFVKSPMSNNIKMNIRSNDGIIEYSESFKVIAISEITHHFLIEVYKNINKYSCDKKEIQLIIVSVLLWLISKSYKVQIKYENTEKKELFEILTEMLVKDYKKEILIRLELEEYFDNNLVIISAYKKSIEISQEYPFVQKDFDETTPFRIRSKLEKEKMTLS